MHVHFWNIPTTYYLLKNEFSNNFNFFLLSRRPGEPRNSHAVLPPKLWIHLAVVACGSRLEETLVMLKSAVLFSHRKMQFHIFTEEPLKSEFDKQVNLQKLYYSMYWVQLECILGNAYPINWFILLHTELYDYEPLSLTVVIYNIGIVTHVEIEIWCGFT